MYIDISIVGESDNTDKVREETVPKVKRVLDILNKLGIADSALTTTEYSISKDIKYNWDRDLPQEDEYKFTYSLIAVLDDISKYDIMQQKLAKEGITDIRIQGYGSNNLKKHNELQYGIGT